MPPGYPGYIYLCPPGYPSLLTPWVAVIGSFAYGLWIEAALLALGSLWLWRRWILPRGGAFSVGVVIAAALVASVADDVTAQRDAQTCHVGFFTHYDFQRADEILRTLHATTAQANVAFSVAALMFLTGTFAAARVAVLGWHGQ